MLKKAEEAINDSNFWQDSHQAQTKIVEAQDLKKDLEIYEKAHQAVEDLEILLEFYQADELSLEELNTHFQRTTSQLNDLELRCSLTERNDTLDALLEINPGAGGVDSQDWAEMLMRMYTMWGQKSGYQVKILNHQAGEEAGVKSVSLEFIGQYAFGYLKSEIGIHRLVRLSPFNANHKRHTSFVSVNVYPIVDENIKIIVNPADLSWQTFRASGSGGQHINKVETAVRLKHKPTELVVECQQERSQSYNRDKALAILKSKLYQLELEKKKAEKSALESQKRSINFGSQIRNYVLHPYKLVKDMRTNIEVSDVQGVLNGEIDPFIKGFLLAKF